MSVERLIDLIAERELLPAKLVDKLRVKIAEAEQPMSAEALANFLVRKQHLTEAQAQQLLDAGMTFEPLPMTSVEDDGSSSIFGPSYSPTPDSLEGSEPGEDVFTLIPIETEGELSAGEEPLILEDVMHVGQLSPEDAFRADALDAERPSAEMEGMEVVTARPVALAGVPETSSVRAAPSLRKKTKKKNQWESPLLLIGGGILMLLIICGMTVALILSRRGGDQKLAEARRYRDAGAFAQAISAYEEFVDGYSGDTSWNKARMELALARIRQAVEAGGNFAPALQLAQTELTALEGDKNFDQLPAARPELAELLPQIAQGLAAQAGAAADPTEAQRIAEQAVAALALCRDAKFVSKDLRDDAALAEVEVELARVSRRQETRGELAQTISAIKSAVTANDVRAAYTAHKQLLASHSELAADPQLLAAIVETSAAEQAGIQFVADQRAAETAEHPTPWLAVLTTGNRETFAPAPTSGIFVARIDGAIYAFDVADGRLLWRRYMGFAAGLPPVTVAGRVLVFDSKHQELVSLDEKTGNLVWRQALGEAIAAPLIVGDRAFVAAESGKLFVIDVDSGDRLGYLQFAQPLRVTPIVSRDQKRLYLTGDHSSIYTISLADLKATGVFYVGHSSGSIRVPAAQVLSRLAVLENDGVSTCRLRILNLDADGNVAGQVTERRLKGLAASPPLVESRRLIAVTDRGELDVFDVGSAEGTAALTPVATREPTSREPLVRYPLLTQGAIWVGDRQLTKYNVLPTGNRLPVESLENSFLRSTFDHPLSLFGSVVVHVRRLDNRAGVVVTAIDERSGQIYWNNELAVPPAAAPIVDESNRAIAMADVNGLVYRFDEASLRSRVQDQPFSPVGSGGDSLKLTTGVDWGDGRGAFAAPRGSSTLLIYDPARSRNPVQRLTLPSTVACALLPLGGGVLAPLEVGQVLWLDPSTPQAEPLAFQPPLEPGKKYHYQPAGAVGDDGQQFVITDGFEKIYLVERRDEPAPHFTIVAEQNIGAFPIVTRVVVLGRFAFAAIDGGQLVRFALPTLENAGQTDLPGDVVWGPYAAGELILVATADQQLIAVAPDGSVGWATKLRQGDLAGPPLVSGDDLLIAYTQGTLERRALANGQVVGSVDVEQPLSAAPVKFLDRIVLATHDGSLIVVQQP